MHKEYPANSMIVLIDVLLQLMANGKQVVLIHSVDFYGKTVFSDDDIRKDNDQAIEDRVIA